MTAQIIKGTPIKGAVIGKEFNASERAEFLAAVERVKEIGLTAEVRVRLNNSCKFAGAILTVDSGV